MALTAANVGIAVTGEIYVGPTTAAAPTGTASATTGYTGLGYLSEDGIEEAPDVSREALRAWQNSTVVRETVTDARLAYTFTMIETNVNTVAQYYGTTVTQTATEGTYTVTVAATKGRQSFILDVIDGANIKRIYVASGEIFKNGSVTYVNGSAVSYPCELVCYTAPVVMDTRLKTGA